MAPHPKEPGENLPLEKLPSESNKEVASETRRPSETKLEPMARMTRSVEHDPSTDPKDPSSSGPQKELSYPRRFGHYEILKELGRGGMATVYLANDTRLERRIALKVPHKTVAADPEYMARFLREARSAANLHHPNICTIFEAAELAGTPYMTMALIEGKSLTELVAEENPIPVKRVAMIIRKIALAMDFAHKQGIIHRDLKPSNIMIDPRREPIIMDFGLARKEDSQDESRLTQDGILIGTPIYMAPEVAKKGAGMSGVITDVYSLGVILYELLTGRAPYKGTVNAVLVQVMRGQPKPPSALRPDLDPGIEAICLKSMAKDPAERYQTMGEFAAALREYLHNPDSVTVAAVELVEAEVDEPVATTKTPTEKRRSNDSSGSSRSGSKIRRVDSLRPKKSNNSAGLIAGLIGAAVLAVAVLIGTIILVKKSRKGQTAPEITATDPSPNTPPAPAPPKPPVDVNSFPLVGGSRHVVMGDNDVRLPENFRGKVTLDFKPIEAAGGWHQFQELLLRIDGEVLDRYRASGMWNPGDEKKPIETVQPSYHIRRELLGELKEGRVINVDFFAFVIYPPAAGYQEIRRKVKIHVVKAEAAEPAPTDKPDIDKQASPSS
ncbi:serine/threonine protein kinase [bacterium]|nr:serine/threonine protein kinase [bacterium]